MKVIVFIFISILILISLSFSESPERLMIVRVYVKSYQQLQSHIDFKSANIEIAGARLNEYYDLIVSDGDLPIVLSSGLKYEVVVSDLDSLKYELRGQYRSLDSVNLFLRNLTLTYPNLCVLDSLGLSYENRQMYGVKISDNPSVSEPNEPGVFICGLHHAREWATIEVCLFFADSILRAYNSSPAIQDLVNNHEIWVFPVINPDGYYYDYPQRRSWRKNRQPFYGVIGTDLNRNYLGACDTNRYGFWGALTSGAQSSHNPSSETFMGGFGASSPEITNVVNFFRTHNINTSHSFHSYSELVLWPWGFQAIPTPDNALYVRIGTTMANMIQSLSGGYYTPEQSTSLYPVSSGADDWIYGWNRFVNGVPCLAFTNEVGTSFYQPVSQLDHICRQNFKAIYFLANFSDSVRILVKPAVPPPKIVVPETSATSNFAIYWKPKNIEWTQPTMWQVQELKGYSVITDSFEQGTSAWLVRGFQHSTRRAHSGAYSMYSDSANNISNYIRTIYPYLVQPGDSLIFWCWYNLEKNYDVAVAEVSFDTREWFQLGERMTDTAMSWRRKAYSLEPYVGKSVYIQFRVMTDDGVLKNGFYLDDVYPVPLFANTNIISSAITDTFCSITVNEPGRYFYRVKGYNTANGWGEYSMIDDVVVLSSSVSENQKIDLNNKIALSVMPNIFSNQTLITYSISKETKVCIQIFDVLGQNLGELINSVHKPGNYQVLWNGETQANKKLSTGIYFLKMSAEGSSTIRRILILN
ncbi:MAG: M14 family zinc carboxypeptidase [candidate division WOR-3 bacterium]